MTNHVTLSYLCMSQCCLCTIVHNQAGSYTVLEASLSIPEPDPLPMRSAMLRGVLSLMIILTRTILFFCNDNGDEQGKNYHFMPQSV